MADQRLSVNIYQLADDGLFRSRRTDGSGWDWGWADFQRDWMNATPNRHAYRCLPLTIVNQMGWWIRNPVGFTATWEGSMAPGAIAFEFDSPDPAWPAFINAQFGEGIITWNTPFLFRTEPAGSRLLITGPTNYFRKDAHPLTALIESDWMTMSFTMNYKLMAPGTPIRFEAGEPLFQVIPLKTNIGADLEQAEVRYQRLVDDPAVHRAYTEWSTGRTKFHEAKANRAVRPDQWQKDYFQGRAATGREAVADHMTKIKPPQVLMGPAPPRHDPTPSIPASSWVIDAMAACPVRPGPMLDLTAARPLDSAPRSPQGATPVRTRVDDEWRRWIAENLLLDLPPASLRESMVAAGIDPAEADREVAAAQASPYLRAAARLRVQEASSSEAKVETKRPS